MPSMLGFDAWRSPVRAAAIACGTVAFVAFGSRARADGALTARLAWVRADGAEQCPDATALRTAIADRLGRDVFTADGAISVEATIATGASRGLAGSRWSAQLFVRARDGALIGRRDLASNEPACAPLVDAVAFAIAVALDADAALRRQADRTSVSSAPSAAPSPPPASSSPPSEPTYAAVTPAPSLVRDAALGVRASVGAGLLPQIAWAGSVMFDVALRAGPILRVESTLWPEVRIATAGGGQFGLRASTLTFDVCAPLFTHGATRLDACGSATAGLFTAIGYGFDTNAVSDRAYVALGAGATLRHAIGPAFVEADIDGSIPLVHYDFVVENLGTVWTLPPVNGRIALGAGVHFQ